MYSVHDKKPTKSLGDEKKYSPENQIVVLAIYCSKNAKQDFAEATIDLYRMMPAKQVKQ